MSISTRFFLSWSPSHLRATAFPSSLPIFQPQAGIFLSPRRHSEVLASVPSAMNGLSRLGPALEVALFVLSIVTVALPAQSSSHFAARHRPHLHPVLCRLLVICVATCFGVSGLVRLVSYDNLDIFASRLIELVGQSAGTFRQLVSSSV